MHLAVLVGASTAAYAISLAGVTALQSGADQALILARSPSQASAARISEGHDRLQAEIERSASAYAASAARFDELATGVSSLDTSLDAYDGRMQKVTGAVRAMPGHVSLPSVSRSATTARARPATRAATGASGKP
jgi:hypothetical protein